MKILELRFKNLNSLYGEWFIDFTNSEYISNGIFALTGPTGAGKSTILDAICLALYGSTPRLGKITKSGNEIMSRQTGECFAEVMFESQSGKFLCHWGQHRARKKADGNLTDAKHEIIDVKSGKPIETKKSLVSGVIEEKTGMDFERFTRSILLAQGGFDTFLKADTNKKSEILEQITGTEIYTKISQRVHEKQRDEHEKLNLLLAETNGITILESEEEKDLQNDLDDKQKQETELDTNFIKTGKAIEWINTITGLKKEIETLSIESKKLHSEINIFKPDRNRLNNALKASEFDGKYATLIALRQQQSADQISLKKEEDKLPDLEASAKRKTELLQISKQQVIDAKKNLKTTAPLIQKVRSLDQRLDDKNNTLKNNKVEYKNIESQIKANEDKIFKVQKKQNKIQNELELAQKYLEENSNDEILITGFTGIKQQVNNLVIKQNEINQKEIAEINSFELFQLASQKLDRSKNQTNSSKKDMANSVESLEKAKKELEQLLNGCLLREYRAEKETLLREQAFRTTIASLEEHRINLEDGKQCPLCGAIDHPFAQGNIPVVGEIELKIQDLTNLIQKADEQEAVIEKLKITEKNAHRNLTESEKLEVAATNEKKSAEKALNNLVIDLKTLKNNFSDIKQTLLTELKPFGIEELQDSDLLTLIETLGKRLENWQVQVNKNIDIEKQLAELENELKLHKAVIETQTITLSEKRQALDLLKNKFNVENSERQEIFGTKNPDIEENDLNKAIVQAEIVEKQAQKTDNETQQQLNSTKTNIESLFERISKRISEIEKSESDFINNIIPVGFLDEKQFLQARLSIPERDELQSKAQIMEHRETDLKARQTDRKTRLSNELNKNITDKSLEELIQKHGDLKENLDQLRDEISRSKQKLEDNDRAKNQIKEKQASIEAQKKECNRWENLHSLIGSADGKKYRNFAQGLTFELMVHHANQQLKKMTDRYLLIRDKEHPLELNVIDIFQAGEIRSTKNLSGGESFIVSLTLALGLSKMASRKVRVDSLFLDEGFGTLDEESLSTALETLSGLQQDGKLIGIISHVSALKERISTQINVTPISGGKSKLTGPGCKKIARN